MRWMRGYHQDTIDGIDDLSSVPTGGPAKMIGLGVVLPAVILWYGVGCWLDEEALWYARNRDMITVHGDTAKSLAVAYSSIGLFCHFRWFWGLLPNYLIYGYGIVLSLISFIGGAIWAMVNFMR